MSQPQGIEEKKKTVPNFMGTPKSIRDWDVKVYPNSLYTSQLVHISVCQSDFD